MCPAQIHFIGQALFDGIPSSGAVGCSEPVQCRHATLQHVRDRCLLHRTLVDQAERLPTRLSAQRVTTHTAHCLPASQPSLPIASLHHYLTVSLPHCHVASLPPCTTTTLPQCLPAALPPQKYHILRYCDTQVLHRCSHHHSVTPPHCRVGALLNLPHSQVRLKVHCGTLARCHNAILPLQCTV